MSDKSKLGTIVDGIAASEHLDSSGECLSIEGMDISSLGSADSILNFEHNSKQHPAQVCGKVTFAKKIFKKSDCSNDRERYFWDFCKKPFVYVKGELFDHPDLDHDGARNVAALLRYDNRDKGEKARRLISFSIEGGKIEKKGMNVTKSIARDLALTVKHCNKMCIAEIVDDIKERKDLYKREQDPELPVLTGVYKELIPDLKKNQHQDYQEKVERYQDDKSFKQKEEQPKYVLKNISTQNNMRKALIAGMMGGSPDSKTGMAALASEEIVGQKKEKKIKKGQAPLEFTQMAGPSKPHQDVKPVYNPFAAQQVNKIRGEQVQDKTRGTNISDFNAKTNRAYDFSQGQSREQMKETKGRGNFPTTKFHESIHNQLRSMEQKHPSKNQQIAEQHTNSLINHVLSNEKYFHPKDIESLRNYLQNKVGYKKDISEEILTHLSDFRTSPEKRNKFNAFDNLGEEENQKRMGRIKQGFKRLLPDMKKLTYQDLENIHNERSKMLEEKKKKPVEIQRIPSGVSGTQQNVTEKNIHPRYMNDGQKKK